LYGFSGSRRRDEIVQQLLTSHPIILSLIGVQLESLVENVSRRLRGLKLVHSLMSPNGNGGKSLFGTFQFLLLPAAQISSESFSSSIEDGPVQLDSQLEEIRDLDSGRDLGPLSNFHGHKKTESIGK